MSQAPELLTAIEVAERLRVSPSTISRWARSGELPAIRVGGISRFRTADVERLIAGGVVGIEKGSPERAAS